MPTKDFDTWNTLKKKLDTQHNAPTFQERDIWWCSIGLNIGHETDGKNDDFHRPVLVIRKFNKQLFWGVPLSTQIKDAPYYYQFEFNGIKQSAMITHLRLYDSKRLTDIMGRLSNISFRKVQHAVANQILKK
mgnify:CR=1 FL=1